jgi:hypothetical protein
LVGVAGTGGDSKTGGSTGITGAIAAEPGANSIVSISGRASCYQELSQFDATVPGEFAGRKQLSVSQFCAIVANLWLSLRKMHFPVEFPTS